MNFSFLLGLLLISLEYSNAYSYDDEEMPTSLENKFKRTNRPETYLFKFYRKTNHGEFIKGSFLDIKPHNEIFVDYRIVDDKLILTLLFNQTIKNAKDVAIITSNNSFKTYEILYDKFTRIQASYAILLFKVKTYQNCYERCVDLPKCIAFIYDPDKRRCEVYKDGNNIIAECKGKQVCAVKRRFSDQIEIPFHYDLFKCYTVKIDNDYALNAVCPSISIRTIDLLPGLWSVYPNEDQTIASELNDLIDEQTDVGRLFLINKSIFNRNLSIERSNEHWKFKNPLFKNNTLEFEINKKYDQATDLFGRFNLKAVNKHKHELLITLHDLNDDKLEEEIVIQDVNYKLLVVEFRIPTKNIRRHMYYEKSEYN